MTHNWSVTVNGMRLEQATLTGGTITRGRASIYETASPSTAFMELISPDAAPDLWPQGASGYVDTYADAFAGGANPVQVGVPVVLEVGAASGYVDTYADAFAGGGSTRFTGEVTALDYSPGVLAVTAVDSIEKVGRVFVTDARPSEPDTTRARTVGALVGLNVQVLGSASATLLPYDSENPVNGLTLLQQTADNTDAAFYTTRTGRVIYRTRNTPLPPVQEIAPSWVLADGVEVTMELGEIYNTETVAYGPVDKRATHTVTDAKSVASWGERQYRYDTQLLELADAHELAVHWLNVDKDAQWVVRNVTLLALPNDDAAVQAADGIDLYTPVRVTGLPVGAPVQALDAVVLGYVERMNRTAWEIDLNLAPPSYLLGV